MNGYGGLPTKSSGSEINGGAVSANGDSYLWDSSRNLLFVTLKQRANSTQYKNFCPTAGCDFVWIEASVGNGAYDCMNAAYSGSNSIQRENDDWLNVPFAATSQRVRVDPLSEAAEVSPKTEKNNENNSKNNVVIIASVVGCFGGVAVVSVIAFYVYRRKSRKQQETSEIPL